MEHMRVRGSMLLHFHGLIRVTRKPHQRKFEVCFKDGNFHYHANLSGRRMLDLLQSMEVDALQ